MFLKTIMDMFTKKRAKNAKNMLQLVGYYTNMGEESDINVSRRYIYIYCPAVQIEESNLFLAIEDYIFICSSV